MKGKLLFTIGAMLVPLVLVLISLMLLAPHTASAVGGQTFTVDTSFDTPDPSHSDCICGAGSGTCTLRAAIEEANACPGAQTINFSDSWLITATTALPAITDYGTVIDGGDQWQTVGPYEVPAVRLDGGGGGFSGLEISGTHDCAIYGIEIRGFGDHGIYVHDGAQGNRIGGLDTHQRNVISSNEQNGVRIYGSTTTGNIVEGNYIGANPSGVAGWWGGILDWGNGHHGVTVWYGGDNEVRENLIGDNSWSGVAMDEVPSGEILLNHIGMDINGQPLGNGFYGIHLANDANPHLASNHIAFNRRGVHVGLGADAILESNTIYSNTASTLDPPHGGGILVKGTGSHVIVAGSDILSNTARYGGGMAVEDGATLQVVGSMIRGNHAHATTDSWVGGGGIYAYQAGVEIGHSEILSNTATGVAPALGGGIWLDRVSWATVEANQVRHNRVEENTGGGGGIYVWRGDDVAILRNTIADNHSITAGIGGSAIEIDNDPDTSEASIDANWIADNGGPLAPAVFIKYSGHVTLTNNVIVRNAHAGLGVWESITDIWAINNTIAYNGDHGIELDHAALRLRNAIVAFNTGYGLFYDHTIDTLLVMQNNFWGNTLGASNDIMTVHVPHDPQFFDAGADQYCLLPGSPCIDSGTPVGAPPDSYNGVPRPQGAGFDIGAYEMAFAYLPLVLRNF